MPPAGGKAPSDFHMRKVLIDPCFGEGAIGLCENPWRPSACLSPEGPDLQSLGFRGYLGRGFEWRC
jgi:hypothetical protein